MRPVTVLILHRPAAPGAGPLEGLLECERAGLAERHAAAFARAGATDVRIVEEPTAEPFGARLRRLASALPADAGIVVLGSGSIPLATTGDRRAFVVAAAADGPTALANNRYSADIVALAPASVLRDVPDLPGDNALPRWLAEVAGVAVRDLRARWRLGVDVDTPTDLLLTGVGGRTPESAESRRAADALAGVRAALSDRRAQVTIAGRTSAATLAVLERRAAARVRAFVEERGMRAASRLAQAGAGREPRPRSVLGMLLDELGPAALPTILAELGDAAVVDTRVLLAHRLGADEDAWPAAEDRFASDLLLPDGIRDSWLRELTAAVAAATIPIALGGHTLVGPGLRLLVAR